MHSYKTIKNCLTIMFTHSGDTTLRKYEYMEKGKHEVPQTVVNL